MNNMNIGEWVEGLLHAAYAAGVNPLPTLRRIYPEYVWDFCEYRGDSVPYREGTCQGERRLDLESGGWEIVADGIGDDLAVSAYLIRVRRHPDYCPTCDCRVVAGQCECPERD